MKYLKTYENIDIKKFPKYKIDDYIVLDLDKMNSLEPTSTYSQKYGKIIWINKQVDDFPYDVEFLDYESGQIAVKEDEILRLMTPEEIIANKYNI